jgi:hypothetical protein
MPPCPKLPLTAYPLVLCTRSSQGKMAHLPLTILIAVRSVHNRKSDGGNQGESWNLPLISITGDRGEKAALSPDLTSPVDHQ